MGKPEIMLFNTSCKSWSNNKTGHRYKNSQYFSRDSSGGLSQMLCVRLISTAALETTQVRIYNRTSAQTITNNRDGIQGPSSLCLGIKFNCF
jgi:hypothetical protein